MTAIHKVMRVYPALALGTAMFAAPAVMAQWVQSSPNVYFVSGRVGIGTTTPVHRLHVQDGNLSGRAVYGWAQGGGFSVGITGVTNSTGGFGGMFLGPTYGLLGRATAASGTTYGLWGESSSPTGSAIFGDALSTSGTTSGVMGRTVSPNGRGVYGEANTANGTASGVYGRASGAGALATVGVATAASGGAVGVYGQSASANGTGVSGLAAAATGNTFGVLGRSISSSGAGVYGEAAASSGVTYGGIFTAISPTGFGVWGRAPSPNGSAVGVYGESAAPSGFGVIGEASSLGGANVGVFGHTSSVEAGKGVWGAATANVGESIGVYGGNNAGTGYAVFSNGSFGASGTKSFRIDHPLDPANKYLNHYCAESPDPLNIYSGVATLDALGQADIQLPAYFEAINRDCRYTLTAIGAPMPMLHIAREVEGNAFAIGGGEPGKKVSWEIKAVRDDEWMREYGAPVEQEKAAADKGRYLRPELYDQPAGSAIHAESPPALNRRKFVAPAPVRAQPGTTTEHRRPNAEEELR